MPVTTTMRYKRPASLLIFLSTVMSLCAFGSGTGGHGARGTDPSPQPLAAPGEHGVGRDELVEIDPCRGHRPSPVATIPEEILLCRAHEGAKESAGDVVDA